MKTIVVLLLCSLLAACATSGRQLSLKPGEEASNAEHALEAARAPANRLVLPCYEPERRPWGGGRRDYCFLQGNQLYCLPEC
jgi:hypothetical protein